MQLISIEKQLIGTEEINSVNARDLHQTLEIKKDFSDWFKNQIKSLGLEENIDYIRLPLKGESHNQRLPQLKMEYIITTDTAKHISMASRTPKGKEVRSYFIQFENQVRSLAQSGGTDLTPVLNVLLEQGKALAEQSKAIVNLTEIIKEVKDKQMKTNAVNYHNFCNITELVSNVKVSMFPYQLDDIREAVKKRAKELHIQNGEDEQTYIRMIYSFINAKFDVSSYYHMTNEDAKQAVLFIRELNIN